MPLAPQPTVLLLSDLPAWGRVALASAVPLLESAGFQACSLPTALLSTHGAYPGFVLQPQTEFLQKAWAHLETLELKFAAVAVGFVGESTQFPLLGKIVAAVKASGGLVLVDPILGDHGRRYSLFLITPNLTEAALLLGRAPGTQPETDAEVSQWLEALANLGPRQVVLTSAPFAGRPDQTGVAWYDKTTGRFGRFAHRRWGQGIPGTGDALAARLLGFLLRGMPLDKAVVRAVKGNLADLKRTAASSRPPLWGPEGPLVP